MDPDQIKEAVVRSEGYQELGLMQEAYDELKEIPPDQLHAAGAWQYFLDLARSLQDWEVVGWIIASVSPEAPESLRLPAATFLSSFISRTLDVIQPVRARMYELAPEAFADANLDGRSDDTEDEEGPSPDAKVR